MTGPRISMLGGALLSSLLALAPAARADAPAPRCERPDDACRERLEEWFRTRGYLGMVVSVERPEASAPGGLRVSTVLEDSPADRAGILPGDLIVRWDRQPVRCQDAKQAAALISTATPGRPLPLGVLRNGERLDFELTPTLPSEEVVRQKAASHLRVYIPSADGA